MNWYPVELHTHSCHSDGDFTIEELVKAAKKEGYSALALTDHNTASGTKQLCSLALENGILPIRGLEWTTYWGHMVVLDENGYTDWRGVMPEEIDEAIRSIHANGGIVGIAHPFALSDPVNTGYHWAFHVHDWTQVDYMEVWSRNYAPNRTQSERAMQMWEELLNQGYHITAMTGRDWHRDDGLPCCYTWVGAEEVLTKDILLNAIHKGRICLTAGPLLTVKWTVDQKEYVPGDCIKAGTAALDIVLDTDVLPGIWDRECIKPIQIRLISNGKEVGRFSADTHRTLQMTLEPGWFRVDLFGEYYGTNDCRIAMSNPLWVTNA